MLREKHAAQGQFKPAHQISASRARAVEVAVICESIKMLEDTHNFSGVFLIVSVFSNSNMVTSVQEIAIANILKTPNKRLEVLIYRLMQDEVIKAPIKEEVVCIAGARPQVYIFAAHFSLLDPERL